MIEKLVCGVGVNDADYSVQKYTDIERVGGKRRQKLIWMCPYYSKWRGLLKRCCDEKFKKKYPTYINCKVCDDWLLFSNFKAWMEQQDWEGKSLDKDLLIRGNKVYSPETCCFITESLNNFIIFNNEKRGDYPIGVSFHKKSQTFLSKCHNPFNKRADYLGYFSTPEEAHKAWLKRKLELATMLADGIDDVRISEALIKRYQNYSL